jgi:hypothetical protein
MSGLVAVLLLACQSVALAQVRGLGASATDTPVAFESCHGAGSHDGNSSGDHKGRCQSQHASSAPFAASLPAATSLPAMTIRIDPFAGEVHATPPAESRLARIEPPPLSILHCCLRN